MREKLSVVIPIYNEQQNISAVLSEWVTTLRKCEAELQLLAVNDGSTDATHEVLVREQQRIPELEVIDQANAGHGRSCRLGYERAVKGSATWVLQIDSDGQCDPQFFTEFWKKREDYDCIFGCRVSRDDGWMREVVSWACRRAVHLGARVLIADPNVPYRLIRCDILEGALKKIPANFELQNIALALALKRNSAVRVESIPIHFRARRAGSNSLNLPRIVKLGWQMFRDLKRIR